MLNVASRWLSTAFLFFLIAWLLDGGATVSLAQSQAFDGYRIDCAQPKDATESSVCEQSKANLISEKSLILADRQAYLSLFGIVGLVATVLLSTVGTIIAILSTKYIQEQTRILKDSLVQERRAWIKVDLESRGPLESRDSYHNVDIAVKISNLGVSPALNIHTDIRFFEYDRHNEIPAIARRFAGENNYSSAENGRFLLPQDYYYRPWAPSFEGCDKESVVLIVCVSYEVMNSKEIHQTVSTYILDGWDVEHGNVKLLEPHFAQFTAWSGGYST